METNTLFLTLFTLISWGIGSFIAKFATNRIGSKAVFWDVLIYAPAVIITSLILFKAGKIFHADKTGIVLSMLAGLIGSFGFITFYMLLAKKDASAAVPLAALYPALTAILAFIFLKEKLTLAKSLGIALATLAIYLLSL